MSESEIPSMVARTWDDPSVCPFCTAELRDPGEGFMIHLEESPVCQEGFEQWRSSVSRDIGAEWSG